MNRLTAKDIMTRDVVTVTPETTLREVAEQLALHDISGVPVVDRTGHVVGIITERDLLTEACAHATLPRLYFWGVATVPTQTLAQSYRASLQLRARDVMAWPVFTRDESATLEEIADLMMERRINRVPILHAGRLAGIVTREDVLHAIALLASLDDRYTLPTAGTLSGVA